MSPGNNQAPKYMIPKEYATRFVFGEADSKRGRTEEPTGRKAGRAECFTVSLLSDSITSSQGWYQAKAFDLVVKALLADSQSTGSLGLVPIAQAEGVLQSQTLNILECQAG